MKLYHRNAMHSWA